MNKVKIKRLQTFYHRAARSASDFSAINFADGRQSRESARGEGFIGAIAFCQREISLINGNAVGFAQIDNLAARNTAQTIIARGGPNLAFSDDKEVGRITGRHKPLRVEHQPFIRASLDGLDTGRDAVNFGMRVEPRVLHIRSPPPNRNGIKPLRSRCDGRVCGFKFRRNDNRRLGNNNARVLIGRRAQSAREHQADMHTLRHIIGFERLV